jgi:hypothetical protein
VSTSPADGRTRRTPGFATLPGTAGAGLLVGAFLALMLAPLVAGGSSDITTILPTIGYLMLAFVTWGVVAGVRREPGSWLGRRSVRRVVVAAIAADCAGVVASSAPGIQLGAIPLLLLLFLVLLNIALGRATERRATAPDVLVDERQEALRNHAHRLAYPIFAGIVGALLIADLVSSPSREWAEHVLGSGGFFVFLELLFVLPGMVLAVIEPAPPPPEPDLEGRGRTANVRLRIALALVFAVFALPVVASVSVVVLPLRIASQVTEGALGPEVSSTPSSPPAPGSPAAVLSCHDFSADVDAGWGVFAEVPVRAEWCFEGKVLNVENGCEGDILIGWSQSAVTVGPQKCTPVTAADGAMSVTWTETVTPELLPFLSRHVDVQVIIDKNGHVEVHT